jgi:hypothetical protein
LLNFKADNFTLGPSNQPSFNQSQGYSTNSNPFDSTAKFNSKYQPQSQGGKEFEDLFSLGTKVLKDGNLQEMKAKR